jgi:Protein involved in initiation of plasmid replication
MTLRIGDVLPKISAEIQAVKPEPEPPLPPLQGKNRPLSKRGEKVSCSNALARAAQGLTLIEKRVVSCCIAQINSKEEYNPDTYIASTLSAQTYADQFDLDIDTAYLELKKAAGNLLKRTLTFFELVHISGRKKPATARVHSNWVQHAKYVDKFGYIEILWTKAVGAELKGLKGRFTSYRLRNATALRSIYSWRLLELFESYKGAKYKTSSGRNWCELSVDDFATLMNATEKQRKNFNNIRRRMIEPAVKDLIEKDGWLVEWTPLKYGGRKISGIRFEFIRDPQGRLFPPS